MLRAGHHAISYLASRPEMVQVRPRTIWAYWAQGHEPLALVLLHVLGLAVSPFRESPCASLCRVLRRNLYVAGAHCCNVVMEKPRGRCRSFSECAWTLGSESTHTGMPLGFRLDQINIKQIPCHGQQPGVCPTRLWLVPCAAKQVEMKPCTRRGANFAEVDGHGAS